MTDKELAKKLLKKIKKLQKYYKKHYPNGNYLSISFSDESIMFNNEHWGNDSKMKIQVYEVIK